MLHLFTKIYKCNTMQDIRLQIHIKNTEPIELLDFTRSLVSLNNQYNSYVKKNTADNISSDAKLYVKEIRKGSVINGDVNIVVKIDSTESNAIQNSIRREIESLRSTQQTNTYSKVLMTWDQASSNLQNNTRNKGVIEGIFQGKSLKILFENENDKKSMLYGDENPLTQVYEVDVKVETSQNKPIAYRITHLHDKFEIE